MKTVDKNKFKLIKSDTEHGINDVPLETKQIGYYKDAWNRFKKNKASLVAAIIIVFTLIFTLIGPYLKVYDLYERSTTDAGHFAKLTPRIPVLEKLGIFDGSKTIVRDKVFLNSLHEGVVLEIIDENYGSLNDKMRVKVDFYQYTWYTKSMVREDGTLMTRSLTESQYKAAVEANTIIDVLDITKTTSGNTMYSVRVDLFKHTLNQSVEDTYFWFGTTVDGRDLFTELWKATRISIMLAVTITVVNAIVGLILGAISGYYGGTYDLIFDRFVEILSGLPFLAVLTLLILRFGQAFGVIIIAFTATGWISTYGRTRIQYYRFKNHEYVLAARTLGAKDRRIMFKHILPNAIGILITGFALSIPSFIFAEANYSFLGIINYVNATSIGLLLSTGQENLSNDPHLLLFPAIYISLLMLSFNLFGNGLRDAFNPSLRGVE